MCVSSAIFRTVSSEFAIIPSLLLTCVCATLVGCSGNDQPRTYPTTGKIAFAGKPMAGALIVFHPKQGDAKFPKPRAQTNDDGTFHVQTFVAKDGLPIGEYDVTVEWWRSPGGDAAPVNQVPARYSSIQTSGLKATIRPEETNVLAPFELKK